MARLHSQAGRAAVIVILTLVLIARAPITFSHTANLNITPDSVEYSVVAQRLVTQGTLDLSLNGASVPSRYPPWFSLVVLAPLYALNPDFPGIAVIALIFFAALLMTLVFVLGEALCPQGGGLSAGILVLLFTAVPYWAQFVMTDVPTLVLGLLAALLYLRLKPETRLTEFWSAGMVCGLAFAFRQAAVFYVLPFLAWTLRRRGNRSVRLFALLLPLIAVEAATLFYNHLVFGEWGRNGYHYWVSQAYDYPNRAFSRRYVLKNLRSFLSVSTLIVLGLGTWGARTCLSREERDPSRRLLLFLLWGALPITLLHLGYFFVDLRFHFALFVTAAILGAAEGTRLFEENRRRVLCLVSLGVLLILPLVSAAIAKRKPPFFQPWWEAAVQIREDTPRNAVIVSGVDPVYLTAFAGRNTERFFVPTDRSVEYASKIAAPHRLKAEPPVSILPLYPELKRWAAGTAALSPIEFTASERPERLLQYLKAGRPVYLEIGSLAETDKTARFLGKAFLLQHIAGASLLRKLELRSH